MNQRAADSNPIPGLSVYLINLEGSDERLAAASQQLREAGVPFVRHPAFDGRGKDPAEFPEYDAARAVAFYGRPMTGGEMGCYFSHIGCAETFLTGADPFGLVLEDDFFAAPGAFEALAELILYLRAEPRTDWDLVNLGLAPKKLFTRIQPIAGAAEGHELVRAHYFPVTTTAILWSRAGAERFLATRHHIYAPVDHFFRRWLSVSGRGLAVIPPLFRPSGADSDLDDTSGGGIVRKRIPRNLSFFWSEFRRQSVNYLAAVWHMLRYRVFGS